MNTTGKPINTLSHELALMEQGYALIAGLDEAGRGPLAGPVVAAGVILPPGCGKTEMFVDSKILSARVRRHCCGVIKEIGAHVGVGVVSVEEIDCLNILNASLEAMKKAILALPVRLDFLLVDGKFPVPISLPQRLLVRGESKSASIAAASIIAKVVRDEMMEQYHHQYPAYNFCRHKGYPTREHRMAVQRFGPCAIHRKTFKGVREYVTPQNHEKEFRSQEPEYRSKDNLGMFRANSDS